MCVWGGYYDVLLLHYIHRGIWGIWTVGEYGPLGNMDHFDKNRKYFLQMSYNSNNNGIKIMLFSPFYGFKNNFQKQTNDKGPFDVKIGGPCKNTR